MTSFGRALAAASIGFLTTPALAIDIAGAGSTFVAPVMAKWSADYAAKTGIHAAYRLANSVSGIAAVKTGSVDFGVTDIPLKADEVRDAGLAQFPLVIGGVVPVVNIDGIGPGQMKFSAKLLADIFLGKITAWNDPAVADLNRGVKLPGAKIIVVHRSDGSGTTTYFARYLATANYQWGLANIGIDTQVQWPVGLGAKGNGGVSDMLLRTRNLIGYVEYAWAIQDKLSHGLIRNNAGRFVLLGTESFQAAASAADWKHAADFGLTVTNSAAEGAYPIASASFVLMPKYGKSGRTRETLAFFRWLLNSDRQRAAELEYVALPPIWSSRLKCTGRLHSRRSTRIDLPRSRRDIQDVGYWPLADIRCPRLMISL